MLTLFSEQGTSWVSHNYGVDIFIASSTPVLIEITSLMEYVSN